MSVQAVSENNSPRFSSHSLNPDFNSQYYAVYLQQCLNTNLLYDPTTVNGLGFLFTESENIADKIIAKIIDDGANILYDKYLEDKVNNHSINRISNLMDYIQKQEYLFYDDISEDLQNNGIYEDHEPLPSQHENWKGLAVAVEKPEYHPVPENISQKELDQVSIQFSRKTGYTNDKMRKSEIGSAQVTHGIFGNVNRRESTAKSAFENEKIPKPVDLSVAREIIREEEQLRVLKERELLIKQEKLQMEAIRNQELKEQQARLKGMQDVNKKLFTYDFDGKFILTHPVKLEKLPPFNYAVNHSVNQASKTTDPTKPNTMGQNTVNNSNNNTNQFQQMAQQQQNNLQNQQDAIDDKKNPKKTTLIPLQNATQRGSIMNQLKQNLGGEKEKERQPTFQNVASADQNRQIFEHFSMASGVTLIEQSKQKQGPKFGANLDYTSLNISNLNRTLVEQGNSIRMTKSEYNSITRSGNLSRQNKLDGTKIDDEGHNQSDVHGQGGLSFLLNDSKLKNYSQFNNSMMSRKRAPHNTSTIKVVDPSKLIETMKNLDQYSEEQMKELELAKQQQMHRKSASSTNLLKMNPIDEFNMQIYQNKHVNEKKSDLTSLPPIPVPKPNEFLRAKQALGFLPQNPRERAPKRVIIANLSSKRLPPPGLGKTIGHGFDQGINPDKLETLEGILERIQNNSLLNGSQILR